MTIKRELIRKIKLMKNDAVPLSPTECDELISILGGTIRPPNAPKKWVRPYNFASIGGVFFSYFENSERLEWFESRVRKGVDPRLIAQEAEGYTPTETSSEWALNYVNKRIEQLRPISAKRKRKAYEMTAEYFTRRGHPMGWKKIENCIKDLKEAAGFGKGKKFGLIEWRELMAEEYARCERVNAKAQAKD